MTIKDMKKILKIFPGEQIEEADVIILEKYLKKSDGTLINLHENFPVIGNVRFIENKLYHLTSWSDDSYGGYRVEWKQILQETKQEQVAAAQML